MRIMQINAVYPNLSTGRNVFEMNHYFRSKGHTCIAIFAQGSAAEDEGFAMGSLMDQKFHALMSRVTGLQGYFSHKPTTDLIQQINCFQPDVVVLNNLHSNYIHFPKLMRHLAKKNIATVAVLHDCWFFTGKCCHYTVRRCYKWQEQCGHCPARKAYNKSWFFDRTKKMHYDKVKLFGDIQNLGVVAVSDWLLKEAKRSAVFKHTEELQRIYNWIDTARFAPRETIEKRKTMGLLGKKVILCVASIWSEEKGIDSVYKVADQLIDNEVIVLVGKMPVSTPAHKKIIQIDRTDSIDELAELYSMADVFFQPSLEESCGKVSAEALSCGTPVICFDSTANPEMVQAGCGKVIPAGNIDGVASAIREITSCEKSAYSHACRAMALEKFQMQNNIEEYARLFERLSGCKA